jgi:hypothetical protein
MAVGYQVGGVDFDSIFAPNLSGTFSGPSNLQAGGADLNGRYEKLSFGTAAAATGYQTAAGGADVNTLWAAIGTPVYNSPLPVQGLTMTTACRVSGGSGTATSVFNASSGGWIFNGSAVGGVQTLTNLPQPASGIPNAVPSGAAFVQVVATLASGVAGVVTNTLSSMTALSTGGAFQIQSTGAATPGNVSNYALVVNFFNASGTNISTTTCNLVASHGA